MLNPSLLGCGVDEANQHSHTFFLAVVAQSGRAPSWYDGGRRFDSGPRLTLDIGVTETHLVLAQEIEVRFLDVQLDGMWRSLEARLTGGQKAGGSNPSIPTGANRRKETSMSGSSHDYAYSKVHVIAEDYGDLDDRDISDVQEEHKAVLLKLKQHPLRVALAKFLYDELAPVLKSIEWSDSTDNDPDAWITDTQEFLEKHNITHDLSEIQLWQAEYERLLERSLNKHGSA